MTYKVAHATRKIHPDVRFGAAMVWLGLLRVGDFERRLKQKTPHLSRQQSDGKNLMANSLIRLMIRAGPISGWQSGSYPETGFWDIERGPQVRDFGDEAVVIGVQSLLTMSGRDDSHPALLTA
jgi:hypothetical protein